MSTRSVIIVRQGGKYKGIYCHSDGYVSGVGATLLAHYTNQAKVEQLISLGDLSRLGAEVAPNPGVNHSFQRRAEGVSVAYGRDRGEQGTDAVEGTTPESVRFRFDHDYAYLFEDGAWTVSVRGRPFESLSGEREK